MCRHVYKTINQITDINRKPLDSGYQYDVINKRFLFLGCLCTINEDEIFINLHFEPQDINSLTRAYIYISLNTDNKPLHNLQRSAQVGYICKRILGWGCLK